MARTGRKFFERDPSPQFEVFIDDDDVCVVRGELDDYTGKDLVGVLASHPAITTVDLGEVSFVDSAGLKALLMARRDREVSGAALQIRRSSSVVRRVMRLAGIAHLFAYQPGSAAAG